MRAMLILAGLAVMCLPAAANATAEQRRAAYDAPMKCFVVNGNATGERRDAGDTATAATYEAQARKSFDLAVKLGQSLGYTRDRMDQDFGIAQASELPKLVADPGYYRSSAAACRSVGL